MVMSSTRMNRSGAPRRLKAPERAFHSTVADTSFTDATETITLAVTMSRCERPRKTEGSRTTPVKAPATKVVLRTAARRSPGWSARMTRSPAPARARNSGLRVRDTSRTAMQAQTTRTSGSDRPPPLSLPQRARAMESTPRKERMLRSRKASRSLRGT